MKITTLIPAYKTKYIPELLIALRHQTILSNKIIISDDSPNGEFRDTLYSETVSPLLQGLDISLHEGPRNGAFENFKHLTRLWNGSSDLFHILLDDDVIYPEFYERHLSAHASGNFSCSISRRWEANEAGQPISSQPVPLAVAGNMNRMLALEDDVAFMATVAECKNWLGEFSNAVFRAEHHDLILTPRLGSVSYAGLWDLGAFLAASTRQPLCYILDHLGYFRKGPDQNSAQANSPLMKGAVLGYVALAIAGQQLGKLTAQQASNCFAGISGAIAYWYASQEDMAEFRQLMPELAAMHKGSEERFLKLWNEFQRRNGF